MNSLCLGAARFGMGKFIAQYSKYNGQFMLFNGIRRRARFGNLRNASALKYRKYFCINNGQPESYVYKLLGRYRRGDKTLLKLTTCVYIYLYAVEINFTE